MLESEGCRGVLESSGYDGSAHRLHTLRWPGDDDVSDDDDDDNGDDNGDDGGV
jgi:hypothetical protein